MSWLISNLANIAVVTVVAALIAAALVKIVRDRKKGIGSCGCSCASCPHHAGCSSAPGGLKNRKAG